MDSLEHQTWLSDIGRKFPAIPEWTRTIKPVANYHALLDSWENVMADLPLEACLAVNLKMLSGELDGPGEWPAQWQGLPARMRRHVKTLRDAEAGHMPTSASDRFEHSRNLIVLGLRKRQVAPEVIDAWLVSKGLPGIVVPSRDFVSTKSPRT